MRSRFFLVLLVSATPEIARAQSAFPQGIAAGDVTGDHAVCWTRVIDAGLVQLDVATDSSFTNIVFTQLIAVASDTDFIAKIDAGPLAPAADHYYRFIYLPTLEFSATGHFKTAPAPDDAQSLRFVYSGDSNAADQPFRLLDFVSDEQPDFWFWAGDTAYCDQDADGVPAAFDLDGYRAKHRQNRDDASLQHLLAGSPVWAQWDDHEVANDYDGADPEPDVTPDRKTAGYRAFFEYMPLRASGGATDPRRIYRTFQYGSLAQFFILDCRQYRSADAGRAGGGLDPYGFIVPPFDLQTLLRIHDPSRTMLGADQLAWLKDQLLASTATWKFVLSSVPLTSLLVFPYDRWDGYDAERYNLLRFIDVNHIPGVVFLSADIHGNAYNPDLAFYLRTTDAQLFSLGFRAPEFIVGPIATETTRQEFAGLIADAIGSTEAPVNASPLFDLAMTDAIAQVRLRNALPFVDINHYAYLVVDVGPTGATFTHRGIPPDPTIDAPTLETLNTTTLPNTGCGTGLPLPFLGLLAAIGLNAVRRGE